MIGAGFGPVATITEVLSFEHSNSPIARCVIDSPKATESSFTSTLVIEGWAIGRGGQIVGIDVIHDGALLASCPVDLGREDVTALIPDAPVGCGFRARLCLLGLPPTFSLEIRAILHDGRVATAALVHGTRFRIGGVYTPQVQPLMVTGLGRTGTTWLMSLLAQHPDVVVHRQHPYELGLARYWMHLLNVLARPADERSPDSQDNYHSALTSVGANPYYGTYLDADPSLRQWLGRDWLEKLAGFCMESIDSAYLTVAQLQSDLRPRFFAEKYLPNHLPVLIRKLYPHAREIVLVRDPRDILCSILSFNAKRGRVTFGREEATSDLEFVHQLGTRMRRLLGARRSRHDSTHLVRYEDLVFDPVGTLTGTLSALGLAADEPLVRDVVATGSIETDGVAAHRTATSPTASVGRWRYDLPPDLKHEANEVFADILSELDYSTPEVRP